MSTHECLDAEDFRKRGRKIREDTIKDDFDKSFPEIPDNNNKNKEEKTYRDSSNKPNYIANYTKGLSHHPQSDGAKWGEVDQSAYQKLLHALCTGDSDDFDLIPLGDSTPCHRKLTNPQAGLAFDLEGSDSRSLEIPIEFKGYISEGGGAPKISSKEAAGEMAELYWMSLSRDINFSKYSSDGTIAAAANDLDDSLAYTQFPIPKYPGGHVNTTNIFRGAFPGDLDGPFISQFLLRGNDDALFSNDSNARKYLDGFIKYGSLSIDQRQGTVQKGIDYIKDFSEWFQIQNGSDPRGDVVGGKCKYKRQCGLSPISPASDGRGRFIRNLRDLSNYVHYDDLPQEFLNACLILKHLGIPQGHDQPCAPQPHGPVGVGNPYLEPNPDSQNQEAIATFGDQYILTLVAEVARRALYAAWFQKWFVHRRLRPEEFGGLIHRKKMDNSLNYPIDNEILKSKALIAVNKMNGSYLLPQAYPEGCAMHPSYPSGHATMGGACVTILKAYFDENQSIPNPVEIADDDGTTLKSYSGTLTIGNELNKLTSNIAIGRNAAGIHYRSDYVQGALLGEAVAINLLEDQRKLYNEDYFFEFTKFDGEKKKIGNSD